MRPAPAQPLVSVVLPTHNRSRLLARAMQSVLAQTYSHLELIVVDDGSYDDTPRVAAGFTDSRVRYLRVERSSGASAARNLGIRIARGEFVAFQDDDDVWLIDRLGMQLRALLAEGEDAGLSLSAHFLLKRRGPKYVGGRKVFERIDFSRGVRGGFALTATPAWLVRRALLEEAGLFDERMRVWEDWELALRLSRLCRIVHVEEPLFIHDRVQGGGLLLDERAQIESMRIVMEKHGAQWRSAPVVCSHHYFTIGRLLCSVGSLEEGRQWLRRAIGAYFMNYKAWLVLVASFAGSGVVRWTTKAGRRARELIENLDRVR